ncbi:hypothetical protein CEXT_23531 [Caerostris extrusa]|uniref:Uncharacterized protein n=1 Tax=Caerostris extrusa TaxID=172846 RepID=A0AAV4P716_CAEEX|nr:hypothetical protein CEXT_23531 [Caerostris extrusa]
MFDISMNHSRSLTVAMKFGSCLLQLRRNEVSHQCRHLPAGSSSPKSWEVGSVGCREHHASDPFNDPSHRPPTRDAWDSDAISYA